ncbi:STE3-domain-containing protein [Rickenella mellea]|uniref:STE3-domain-containing protein n=1 Tax=Rickenella mellea TaxID=50990 RepID=A0A4Y7QJC8_9AGAM|nr:STE3-domain-containing protein [Rickenella mellea]
MGETVSPISEPAPHPLCSIDMKSDPTYPAFPIFSFIGFVLALVPISWHLQAWNGGTCLYMLWASVACLNYFINSIVWHGNALNPAPVWCDISIRVIIGTSVAIPAASLCINRRLFKIAIIHNITMTRSEKRRAILEDMAIGLGIPFLEMGAAYIVSGHRFDIFEDIGCFPNVYNVWPSIILVGIWPIVLGLVSAVYCVLTLREFYKRNVRMKELLSTNSSLTMSRYFRLMILATTELLCTTPLATYALYSNLTSGSMAPYKGWADTHFNYSRVDQVPSVLWRSDHQFLVDVELSRWLVVVCALVFFMFFGFADEALRHYRMWFSAVTKVFGFIPLPSWLSMKSRSPGNTFKIVTMSSSGTLPVFVSQNPHPRVKRDSFGSIVSDGDISSVTTPSGASICAKKEEDSYAECYGHAV